MLKSDFNLLLFINKNSIGTPFRDILYEKNRLTYPIVIPEHIIKERLDKLSPYLSSSTDELNGTIYHLSELGIETIEEHNRKSNEEKCNNKRWFISTLIAVLGAATGISALLWNIFRQLSQ